MWVKWSVKLQTTEIQLVRWAEQAETLVNLFLCSLLYLSQWLSEGEIRDGHESAGSLCDPAGAQRGAAEVRLNS